jgi:hypothetical protein
MRRPEVSTIFGCTYVQGQTEGLASYHFESETACFISYAAAPDHWTLDDGSRPPEQKHFSDVSYNPLTRTFTGKIDWSPRLFGGDQIWAYKLIFSDNFDIVCGGHIKATLANGMQGETLRFPRHLRYKRRKPPPASIFGCIFVQFQTLGLASYHFESEEVCYINYAAAPDAAAPDAWVLGNGSMPPPKKEFLDPEYNHTMRRFRGVVDWTPTTFNGDQRWEYEMFFDADLSTVISGKVRRFAGEGEELPSVAFEAMGLRYERHDEAAEYIRSLVNLDSEAEARENREARGAPAASPYRVDQVFARAGVQYERFAGVRGITEEQVTIFFYF